MGLGKALEGEEGDGRSAKLPRVGWLKENDPEAAKGEAALLLPTAPAAPRVLGEREAPSLPPWEQPRCPCPSACCRGISRAAAGDGGDVPAGCTEQTPLAHPSSAPCPQSGQSIPGGATVRQHPPMPCYTPGEKTSPALQRSTPKVLWPAPNNQGDPWPCRGAPVPTRVGCWSGRDGQAHQGHSRSVSPDHSHPRHHQSNRLLFCQRPLDARGRRHDGCPPASCSPRAWVRLESRETVEGKNPAKDRGGRNRLRESNQDGAGARCAGGREAGRGCVLSNRKCFISWEWWREARQEEAVIRNIFLTSPTSRPQSACQAAAFGQRGRRAEPPGPGRGRRRCPARTGDAEAAGAPTVPGRATGGEQTHEAPPSRGARHGAELPRLSHTCRL